MKYQPKAPIYAAVAKEKGSLPGILVDDRWVKFSSSGAKFNVGEYVNGRLRPLQGLDAGSIPASSTKYLMIPNLTTEENQFLTSTLVGIQQNSLGLTTPSPQEMDMISEIILKTIFKDDFTAKEISYLQTVMQIQSEIWGRQSSTANEKLPVTMGSFVPQHTRVLIKSISTKLGASIMVDIDEPSIPNSPRKEGSRSIVVDPTLIK